MTHTEIEITADLIRELLREQHPDLADRPVVLGARGWDNQLWRLGDDLAVRLPWATESADELLLKEYAWLPALAPQLPLPVPLPQRLGEPSERFGRPWIVTTWLPGTPADRAPATRAADAANSLAAFLTALHRPAPEGAPLGRGRGGPLADHADSFAHGLASLTEQGLIPDPDAVRAVWEDAVAAPVWEGPAVWLHGDLHPANVLTADGTLCGVIDFGDLCAGDPACDLAAPWVLLPDGAHERFHRAYQPAADAATLRRARGWAVLRAFGGIAIGDAGVHGRPGGKATWGPPAHAALRRLVATAGRADPATASPPAGCGPGASSAKGRVRRPKRSAPRRPCCRRRPPASPSPRAWASGTSPTTTCGTFRCPPYRLKATAGSRPPRRGFDRVDLPTADTPPGTRKCVGAAAGSA